MLTLAELNICRRDLAAVHHCAQTQHFGFISFIKLSSQRRRPDCHIEPFALFDVCIDGHSVVCCSRQTMTLNPAAAGCTPQ